MFGIRPKIIIENSNKNNNLVWLENGEVGDKVLHWNLKGQPHVLLDFCELKKTYHQGGTHTGMEEGVRPHPRADCDHSWVKMEDAQTDIGDGVGPPLRVGCDQSCRYRGVGPPLRVGCDQLWASLGPPLTYMYISGVQNVKSMGAKV